MKTPEIEYWNTFTQSMAAEIGLRDWRFQIRYDKNKGNEHTACITRIIGRKHAIITLTRRFLRQTNYGKAQTIAHELIHCHTGALQDLISDLEGVLPAEAFYILYNEHERLLEFAVDALADVVADHLSDVIRERMGPDITKISSLRS